jgi:exonuclease VII small subunit
MSTKEFSLQKKVEELETIEAYFQRQDINLDEALGKHQKAMEIAKEIYEYLDTVESKLEKISLQMDSQNSGFTGLEEDEN